MTTIPALKSLVWVIPSRFSDPVCRAACTALRLRLFRYFAGGLVVIVLTIRGAAAGEDRPIDPPSQFGDWQTAQSHVPGQGSPTAQIRQAQRHCRNISRQLRKAQKANCARGDRLDAARSLCVPPKGIFKSYSRWDPAAGRCKPRHRFDGGTCAGGKRRYRPGNRYAHDPARSVRMYGNAPARLAAAHQECRRDLAALRSRFAAERIFRQRKCAKARRLRDRSGINFHCR